MGSPFSGGTINGPPFSSLTEKVSWVEKFVKVRPPLCPPNPPSHGDLSLASCYSTLTFEQPVIHSFCIRSLLLFAVCFLAFSFPSVAGTPLV